jgi:hypothetical protein
MLVWIEGFEGFGTGGALVPTGILARKYPVVDHEAFLQIEAGRLSGYCLRIGTSTYGFGTGSLTTDSTITVGMGFNFSILATSHFLNLYDGTTLGINVQLESSGEISIRKGTTTLETTSGLGLLTNTWYYIELQVKCDSTTGTYELRIDENTVLSDTGVNTKAGTHNYHDRVYFYGIAYSYFDDLYILDSTGSQNNDFLGNSRVEAIYPDGDTATIDWTASSGNTHYNLVDEVVCDDDTNYVEDGTANDVDLYDYATPSYITGIIRGLQVNTQAKLTDATPYNLITRCHSNVTDSDDSPQPLASSYVCYRRLMELDPDSGLAWNLGSLASAEFGIKVG